MTIQEKLKLKFFETGIRQEEIAQKLNTSQANFNQYLSGKRKHFPFEYILVIQENLQQYGITPDWYFKDTYE